MISASLLGNVWSSKNASRTCCIVGELPEWATVFDVEATLIDVEATLIDVEATLIDVEAALIDVEATLIDVEATLIDVEAAEGGIDTLLLPKGGVISILQREGCQRYLSDGECWNTQSNAKMTINSYYNRMYTSISEL